MKRSKVFFGKLLFLTRNLYGKRYARKKKKRKVKKKKKKKKKMKTKFGKLHLGETKEKLVMF